jgi:hypothetical protein
VTGTTEHPIKTASDRKRTPPIKYPFAFVLIRALDWIRIGKYNGEFPAFKLGKSLRRL